MCYSARLHDSLDCKLIARAGGLRLREVILPGMRRQYLELTGLQRDDGIGQLVRASRQIFGRPQDMVVENRRGVEKPPTPAFGVWVTRVI